MSEQKQSFMQALDEWVETTVIQPLYEAYGEDREEFDQERFAEVKKAIRAKVLESYRNGQAAGPTKPVAPRRSFTKRER